MNLNKTILVLASTFPRWENDDVPPFVFELTKQYTSQTKVVVLAPFSNGSKRYEVVDGMFIHRFNYWPFANKLADGAILPNLKTNNLFWLQVPFFLLFEFLGVWKMIRKYKPSVIHAHWIIPQGIVAVLVKRLLKWDGAIYCTTHGGDIFGLQFLKGLKKWVVKQCSAMTVVSQAIKDEIDSFELNIPVSIIPMGVDSSKFHARKSSQELINKYNVKGKLLLFVGRLSEKKGAEYLIKAMPLILVEEPQTKLLIVGHGELKSELEYLAFENLKLEDCVIFVGGIPNSQLATYYASADIFIGPSIIAEGGDREGFPVSFMEAMACNTPVVTSDIEIFKPLLDGEHVLKAKEKSTEDIAKTVLNLIQNDELRDSIAKGGYKLFQDNYSLEKVGGKYIELLTKK